MPKHIPVSTNSSSLHQILLDLYSLTNNQLFHKGCVLLKSVASVMAQGRLHVGIEAPSDEGLGFMASASSSLSCPSTFHCLHLSPCTVRHHTNHSPQVHPKWLVLYTLEKQLSPRKASYSYCICDMQGRCLK